MFQTFAFVSLAGVLLCGVGYALYKKVIQMLKDIDEKYEGKLKTLVFELEVKREVSINQLLKDIVSKYELKINHQESIQKLENTIEYNLEHTETLAIDLNNKLRLLKNELGLLEDKVKEDLVLLKDKIKDELKEDLVLLEDKVKDELKTELVLSENKVKNELNKIDKQNEFENALVYCGVGIAHIMPRNYLNKRKSELSINNINETRTRYDWSENMVRCFNSSERFYQLSRSDFCVKCEYHTGANEKYCGIQGSGCQNNHTPCGKFIKAQLQDATIIEINNKKYILSKLICSNIPNGNQSYNDENRAVYNMKKSLLFNYEPDFKPKLDDKTTTYKWYQVGSIDRITKEIIWEPNYEPVPVPTPKDDEYEEEDEEPVVVKMIEYEGKKYLKSKKTGIVYDYQKFVEESEQVNIGRWNEKTNKIDFDMEKVSYVYIAGNYYLETADKVLYDPKSMYEVGKWNSTLKAYNINKLQINKGNKLDKNYKIINKIV
jgi:hypothetical protein